MNGNSSLTNNPLELLYSKNRQSSPFLNEFLFIGLFLFFVSMVVMSYEIWNSDEGQVHLFEANFETFNWEHAVYPWYEGDKPVKLQKVNDPDRNNWQVLSIKKEANEGWSGIGKAIVLHTTPTFDDIVKIRIKNNSAPPLPISFEIQEASTASHPISEVWNTEFTLESNQWETLEIPLNALSLKNYYQPDGKTGNHQFDLWPLSQFSIVFQPNMDIDVWLDTIHLTVLSYPRFLIAILILDFLWWIILLQQVLRKSYCKGEDCSVLLIQLIKFGVYQTVLIATPNRSGVAVALCFLLVYCSLESLILYLSCKKAIETQRFINWISPLAAASFLMLYAPSWSMFSPIVAAHCYNILHDRKKHGLEWAVTIFLSIFLFKVYALNNSIYPIPLGIGLLSFFIIYYFLSSFFDMVRREKKQIEFQVLYEQQIQHNQKMEAITQITRGIAHEFNNLLTGIMGNLKMMQLKKNQDVTEFTQNALDSTVRAADLIKKLQMYGRLSHIQPKETHLNSLLNETVKIFKQSLQKNISLKTNLFESDEILKIDPLRMKIVFMNLFMNAREAIDSAIDKGLKRDFFIGISSSYVDLARQDRPDYSRLPGRYTVVTIADNGIGMDRGTLKKVFDPFYSTKEVTINTGLGLSCAYGIVKEHKGWIDVNSELGEGTQFRIFLPCETPKK